MMIKIITLCLVAQLVFAEITQAQQLSNTKPLTLEGDIASHLVDGVDRFLLQQLQSTIEARARYWNRDTSSADAYVKSVTANRDRCGR